MTAMSLPLAFGSCRCRATPTARWDVDYARHRAIFCGDAMHSPLQIVQPGLSTSACTDPEQASRTRRTILAEAAERGRLVVPAHFRGGRCAHIRTHGSDYTPVFDVSHG